MNLNTVKTDKIFAIFFSLFFTLYRFPIIQIILFIILGFYVINDFIKRRKCVIDIGNLKNLKFLLIWFGVFVLYAIISKSWAIGIYSESRTITTLLRMLYVGILIFLYCDSKEKALSIIKAFIYGVFFMCVVVILSTPPSLYGVESGEHFFGEVIRQHRNSIGGAAAEAIIYTYFISKISSFSHSKKLMVFFAFIIIISGSRGALIELFVFFVIYGLLNIKNKKFYKSIPIALIVISITFLILCSNEYTYNKIILRIIDMIDTLINNSATDGSTYSRSLLKKVAYNLFQNYPIFGAGLDGVEYYLSYYPLQFGHNLRTAYSHCNYTEIAANFGIVGLAIWYCPIMFFVKKIYSSMKKNEMMKILISAFIAMVFTDNYKIPWSSDILIFSYFTIIVTILWINISLKKEEITEN